LEEQKKYPELTSQKLLLKIYFGNIFSSSFLIIAWSFIYIGITNARKAKASQLDNLRLQNNLKEAQLSSLSNQLNPHFLFNSLNNIRFMIHENAEQADNMITALSEVLRYSLESSQHEKRLLSKEVEVIQRYIEIVNIQFEDRLNFTMDIPDSLMDMPVPPMFLQMLIENAVKHGLEQMQHGGDISVTAVSRAENTEFCVVNDIPENGSSESNSTGLGLKNIQQRLSLLYAGNASIEAKQVANKFQVKICLPH
jgi:LytS/YehU family sensor histidine kinase